MVLRAKPPWCLPNCEIPQEPVDGRAADAGVALEPVGRLAGQRAADDGEAAALPDLAGGVEGVGLARSGLGHDDVDAGTRGRQLADEGLLVLAQRGTGVGPARR